MVFVGGLLWFLQMVVWDDMTWLSFVGWALVVAGLIVWALFSHHGGSGASSDAENGDDGERITGTSVEETAEDEIRFNGTAASAKRIVTSQAFRGGEVSESLGALEIDLTTARLAEDGATLALSSQMGNVTLRVPGDWVVEINGDSSWAPSKMNDLPSRQRTDVAAERQRDDGRRPRHRLGQVLA